MFWNNHSADCCFSSACDFSKCQDEENNCVITHEDAALLGHESLWQGEAQTLEEESSLYMISPQANTYSLGKQYCHSIGGKPAVITSAEQEAEAVASILRALGTGNSSLSVLCLAPPPFLSIYLD